MNTPAQPITKAGWILGVILLPTGMFLSLATARAIGWVKAISWFVFYAALTVTFSRGMAYLESIQASRVLLLLFLHAGLSMFGSQLWLIHWYGDKAGSWSDKANKAWRILGVLFFGLLLWALIGIMLQVVVIPVWLAR